MCCNPLSHPPFCKHISWRWTWVMALLFVYLGCHGILSGRIPNRCCHGNVYGRRTDSSCLQRGNFLQKYQVKNFLKKFILSYKGIKGFQVGFFILINHKNSYFVTPGACTICLLYMYYTMENFMKWIWGGFYTVY